MIDENHRDDLFRLIHRGGVVHIPRNRPWLGLALMICGYVMIFSSLGLMYASRVSSRAEEIFNGHVIVAVLITPVALVGGLLTYFDAQSFGAYRLYAKPTEWPKVVEVLMKSCQLIVLMLDNSPAVSWELSRVAEICGPAKLLLGVPRPSWPEKQDYGAIREWASKALGHHLPQRIGKARYIWFQHDWVPQLISTPTDWDNFVIGTSWRDS